MVFTNDREKDMIVEPKAKGFICTTAHPVGCRENVCNQIAYAKSKAKEYRSMSTRLI